jgi:hypothetical protein
MLFRGFFLLKIHKSSTLLEELDIHDMRKCSRSWKFVVATFMHRRKGKKKCGFYIFELEPRVKEYWSFSDFHKTASQKPVILMVTTVKAQINQAHVF